MNIPKALLSCLRIDHTRWGLTLIMNIGCVLFSSGCHIISPPERPPIPFGADALRVVLDEVVALTRRDPKLAAIRLAELIPESQEMRSLLRGHARAAHALDPIWDRMRAAALRELPWVLDAALSAGMTELELKSVRLSAGLHYAPGEITLLKHMRSSNGLYTARFKYPTRPGEDPRDAALRISGWVYDGARGWRCLLKLGERLEELEARGALRMRSEAQPPTPLNSAPLPESVSP